MMRGFRQIRGVLQARHLVLWLVLVALAISGPVSASDPSGSVTPSLERLAAAVSAVERHLDASPEVSDASRADARRRAVLRHVGTLRASVRSHGKQDPVYALLARLATVEARLRPAPSPPAEAPAPVPETAAEAPAARVRPPARPLVPALAPKGAPPNDSCETAVVVGIGSVTGDLTGAIANGVSVCDSVPGQADLWYRFDAPTTGDFFADTGGSSVATTLSIYEGCVLGSLEVTCDNAFPDQTARVQFFANQGQSRWIRVAASTDTLGAIQLNVGPGGVIRGRITDDVTGQPIEGAEVVATPLDGATFGPTFAYAGSDGRYVVSGLPGGSYVLVANAGVSGAPYLPEAYEEIACPLEGCQPNLGDPVIVGVNDEQAGVDFTLGLGGAIEGSVLDAEGAPIVSLSLELFDATGRSAAFAFTDSEGSFRFEGLIAGDYFAVAYGGSQRPNVLYDGQPCPFGCDATVGTPIPVQARETTNGIDFVLDRFGVIRGRVTREADGLPFDFMLVEAYDAQGRSVDVTVADLSGDYALTSLPEGTTFVLAQTIEPAIDELWQDIPCPTEFRMCNVTSGTPIEVSLNDEVSGIDFVLGEGGAVSGTVRAADDGEPVEGASVLVYTFTTFSPIVFPTSTDAQGSYRLPGLVDGTYFVTASADGFLTQLYDQLVCQAGTCDPFDGTPVPVVFDQETTEVDFALLRGGVLRGRVIDQSTANGVPFAGLQVRDETGGFVSFHIADSAGNYEVSGLAPGGYFVETSVFPTFDDQIYDGVLCPAGGGTCPLDQATLLTVAEGQAIDGIDFSLAPRDGFCVPGPSVLCLRNGRFSVEASWRSQQGASGPARAVPLDGIADSGTFWFFNERNVELVVKVLDGCNGPFESFWVFAAGLTNVEVTINVSDTVTADLVTYRNTLGSSFQPILDTRALPSCDGSLASTGALRTTPSVRARSDAGFSSARPSPSSDVASAPAELPRVPVAGNAAPLETPTRKMGTCTPDATTLCLNENRFAVTSAWETVMGDRGAGQAVPLTDDTGFFWFFDASNIEMVVKALDGCNTAFESFWIFAGGLTNVGVTMTVTDTVSGEEKVYVNPLREPFQPILDTRAFATCMP